MGKLEKSIKSEIVRLARTELRKVSVPLARDVWSLRRAVSQIRKTVLPLQQFTARQQKELQNRKISLEVTPEEMKISRFSPRLVQSLRKHLGLSQRELAILTGVTIGAVQKWESGKFKPKEEKKRRMVALRKLRRKDVRRLLTG